MTTATDNALSPLIGKIGKLRVHIVHRGASPAEELQAAEKIGRLLVEHPEVAIVIGPVESRITFSRSWVCLEWCEWIADTRKAVLFVWRGIEVWPPRSQIGWTRTEPKARGQAGPVFLRKWFFDKEISHLVQKEGAA